MRLTPIVVLCAVLSCDEPAPSAPDPAPPAESEPDVEAEPEPEPEPEPPALRTDIGWAEIPALPSEQARALNKRALREHRRQRYEQSLAGFRSALELAEGYTNARFNVACALAKLERFDDAASELEALFLVDLPTFAPRYADDDDLAEFRRSPQGVRMDAFRDLMIASYTAALVAGPAVVLYRYEDLEIDDDTEEENPLRGRAWSQAGVWVPATRRYVPMGPVATLAVPEYMAPVLRTRLFAERRRAYTGSALDRNSDMGYIDAVHLRVFSVPDGRELGSVRPRNTDDDPLTGFRIQGVEDGIQWSAGQGSGYLVREPSRTAEVTPLGATFDQGRGTLTIGEGEGARVVRMRQHRLANLDPGTQLVRQGDDAILVLTTTEEGTMDGTMYGPWVLSRVDRATGDVERLFRGSDEPVRLATAPDGTVYFEFGGTIRSIPLSGEAETLPSELRLP